MASCPVRFTGFTFLIHHLESALFLRSFITLVTQSFPSLPPASGFTSYNIASLTASSQSIGILPIVNLDAGTYPGISEMVVVYPFGVEEVYGACWDTEEDAVEDWALVVVLLLLASPMPMSEETPFKSNFPT
ncbi:hypothetical protein BKA70DRAFT_1436426 [Coprinopsis sp. MPI-PUGE-AT-0042]|nr:hypothetical protein BKA70DRAFT_1436426 [Coprinopsis sp. MPI-PUGE-AT-0042]